MRCAIIRWWLEEYVDGTLRGRCLAWVRSHVEGCSSCRLEMEWRLKMRGILQAGVVSAPPDDMWEDFQRRLQAQTQTRAARPRLRQAWVYAGSFGLALWLGALLWNVHFMENYRTPSVDTSQQLLAQGDVPELAKPLTVTGQGAPTVGSRKAIHGSPSGSSGVSSSAASKMPRPRTVPGSQQQTPPQMFASVAFAEVRDTQGTLVGRVNVQALYDSSGQLRAVEIECNSPGVREAEHDDQSMDSSTFYDNGASGTAGSPAATFGADTGVSD